jgi:hypothetical protein
MTRRRGDFNNVLEWEVDKCSWVLKHRAKKFCNVASKCCGKEFCNAASKCCGCEISATPCATIVRSSVTIALRVDEKIRYLESSLPWILKVVITFVGCKFVMFVFFYERVPLHIENSKRMLSQFSLEVLILKQGARFFLCQIHEVIILRMGVFRFW